MWHSVIDVVKKLAPTAATAIGGPFAGLATKTIMSALGVDTEEQAVEAIASGDPDVLLKLRKVDNAFKARMRELDIKEEDLHRKDRDSARDLAKATSIVPQLVLSTVYTVAYAVVLWAFVTGKVQIQPEAQAQFGIVLGVLTAAQAQVLNFWFGSSSGSKQKTALQKK